MSLNLFWLNLTTENKGIKSDSNLKKKLWENEYVKVNIHLAVISTLRVFVVVVVAFVFVFLRVLYVGQVGILILRPQLSDCYDYSHVPYYIVFPLSVLLFPCDSNVIILNGRYIFLSCMSMESTKQ